jgi:hypothetical protein
MKDPPKPICTKCTRDEQRIPTLFNKGKPLVSKWVCYFMNEELSCDFQEEIFI